MCNLEHSNDNYVPGKCPVTLFQSIGLSIMTPEHVFLMPHYPGHGRWRERETDIKGDAKVLIPSDGENDEKSRRQQVWRGR